LREAEADEPRRENMDELFQLLVDNVKDYAIFILGTDGRTLSWNAGVLRMLEYNEQEFVGLEFAALFRPGEQDAAAREMQIAAANGRSDDERWHVRKDGAELWVTGVLTALRTPAGELRGYAKIMRDTTLQKSAAAEREQLLQQQLAAREEAERANRIKDDFLAIASHELRTPLNAMLGWVRMLATDHLDEIRSKRALEIIERNAKAQAQLIEDLLDVSRIITGKLQLDVRPLMFRKVVNEAVESVAHTAQEKGVELVVDSAEDDGPIDGDAGRLQQVIWNLLSNAVKFTPAGGRVEVQLQRHDHSVQLRVRDTGEGMESTELPLVFDRFRQAAHRRRTAQGGLGLGLGIARHILEAHGGTIRAHSEGKGTGATFTVDLPLATGVTPANQHGALDVECPSSLDGRRVLVVEDKRDSRELLEIVFEECKMQVVSVDSARAALVAIDGERFDVIVSDIGLPNGEDGLVLMRRVRERPADLGGRTPAIALTAYASATDRRQALAAGYQTYLAKPFEPPDLVAAVASLLSVQKPISSDDT
jgi:PAS domain S-box-containing protein